MSDMSGQPSPRTIARALSHWPDEKIACYDGNTAVTYGQWLAQSRRVAALLRRCDISPGDRVALWLPNGTDFLNTFVACAQLGAIAIAVNTRFKSQELQDILARTGATMLITDFSFEAVNFEQILGECELGALNRLRWIMNAGPNTTSAAAKLADFGAIPSRINLVSLSQANELRALTIQSASASSPCIIFTTSGTTSQPKFVLHDQQTLLSHGADVAIGFDLDQRSRLLLVPPLCGVFGFCHVTAAIMAGTPWVMRPTWDPQQAARDIAHHQVTHLNATDDVWMQLLAQNDQSPAFPSLLYGGYAAFNPGLANIVQIAQARGVTLIGLYGTSEIQALFARQSEQCELNQRQLSGGKPISSKASVRVRDPSSGALLDHQQPGELEFFAPSSRMCRYYGNERATQAAFSPDGWYKSGDLGYTVAQDDFVFLERLGDALRLGGFLTSPLEIEGHIQQLDAIEACQVVSVITDKGPRAFAWVIMQAGKALDEQTVLAFLTPRLARYKIPVKILPIEQFPVTEGTNAVKIQKHRLRSDAQSFIDQNT